MRYWFRGKRGGLIAFLAIAALVVGGLGWVTSAALRLEQEQQEAAAREELNARLREALWLLDSRIWPVLAKEDSRPYNDYSAIYTPPLALRNDGTVCQPGTTVLPSPLLCSDLPDWMLLHFRTGEQFDWGSPQVLSDTLHKRFDQPPVNNYLANVTPQRQELLRELAGRLNRKKLLEQVQQRGAELTLLETTLEPTARQDGNNDDMQKKELPPSQQLGPLTQQAPGNYRTGRANPAAVQSGQAAAQTQEQARIDNEYLNRLSSKSNSQKDVQSKPQVVDLNVAVGDLVRNGEGWFSRNPVKPAPSQQTIVSLGPMVPLWLTPEDQEERLIVARLVQIGDRQVCQGILLDWPRLQALLGEEIRKLFPAAKFEPVREGDQPYPERTMTALPVQLDPQEDALDLPPLGRTPLRIGLALVWMAALVALGAVGLGGWTLIDLSERRIRFVSAVTHELRTPLTTLRLYLDMLTGGMITEEKQKAEYLQTLHAETDRLNRLVGNVLDFSRLENQRPRLEKTPIALADLLEQVRATWQGRCAGAEKELVIDNAASGDIRLVTDVNLVQQVLGNLIDNACKYSQGVDDRRIWLRAHNDSAGHLVLEVEDHGPGVAPRDRRAIFRAFRRGRDTDTTGGVGLGLALAERWASLLGGRLSLGSGTHGPGACFRLELPV